MNKAIFLDRDGVLIEDMHYNCDTKKIFINLNLVPILLELQKDYKIIIVTNQSGVARGYFTMQDVDNFNNNLIKKLKELKVIIDDCFVCPHHLDGKVKEYAISCNCRKPDIGMLIKAKKKHNICLGESFLIGDKKSDIMCGKRAKLKKSFNITKIEPNEILKIIKNLG